MGQRKCLAVVVALAVLFAVFVGAGRPSLNTQPDDQSVTRERDWYRYFFSYYASMERYRQYGLIDDRSRVYAEAVSEFRDISDLVETTICPAKGNGLIDNSYIYFASRSIFLRQPDGKHLVYALSYVGEADWIHGNKLFDAFFPIPDRAAGVVEISEATGIAQHVIGQSGKSAFLRNGGYLTPLSFNAMDINGDGADDFFIGGRLVLSGPNGYSLSDERSLEGREIIFLRVTGEPYIVSPRGSTLEIFKPGELVKPLATFPLPRTSVTNRPFTILPLDEGSFFLVSEGAVTLLSVGSDLRLRELATLTDLQNFGELFIGARGDFTGDGVDDVWLSEPRWKDSDGKTVVRLYLLDGAKLAKLSGHMKVETFATTIITGSTRYTDYDGIGSTLSPVAGDLDEDGLPDLSFSGHRHMSEAGALFILSGKDRRDGHMTVTDPNITKIVGRPVSQIAPPFFHLDLALRGRIVLPVDNDLCAGISSGAMYVIRAPQPGR